MILRFLLFSLASAAGCQDYGVKGGGPGRAETAGASVDPPVPRTVLHVVVRGSYSGRWTGGVIDRSQTCYAVSDEGTDYSACCPDGFDAVGWATYDSAEGDTPYSIVCLERSPGSGRTVLYVGGGGEWNVEAWGSDEAWAPGGTWADGIYGSEPCAVDVRDDALDEPTSNPPDDYRACCPQGFVPVGQAKRSVHAGIVCLEEP